MKTAQKLDEKQKTLCDDAYFFTQKPPLWIFNLKKGVYTMQDLIQLTKLKQPSIVTQLMKYGAKRKVGRNEKNKLIFVYYWDGYKENN